MVNLIGIAGNGIGAGKSTVAQYFLTRGYEKRPFAKLLKDSVVALDPYIWVGTHPELPLTLPCMLLSKILETQTLDEAKRDYPDLRRILQRMGTEVGRDLYHKNFWVDQTLSQLTPTSRWVIDDVRYPNEAAAIRKRKGLFIFVERPEVEESSGHTSEAYAEELKALADIRLVNDTSVEDLYEVLERCLRVVYGP